LDVVCRTWGLVVVTGDGFREYRRMNKGLFRMKFFKWASPIRSIQFEDSIRFGCSNAAFHAKLPRFREEIPFKINGHYEASVFLSWRLFIFALISRTIIIINIILAADTDTHSINWNQFSTSTKLKLMPSCFHSI
jgi:hypothetical protein